MAKGEPSIHFSVYWAASLRAGMLVRDSANSAICSGCETKSMNASHPQARRTSWRRTIATICADLRAGPEVWRREEEDVVTDILDRRRRGPVTIPLHTVATIDESVIAIARGL